MYSYQNKDKTAPEYVYLSLYIQQETEDHELLKSLKTEDELWKHKTFK